MVKVLDNRFKNEKFTVFGKMDMSKLGNLVKALVSGGWEPQYYILNLVVTGNGRPYQITCMKSSKYGAFRSIA
jgi:hypothetical protein